MHNQPRLSPILSCALLLLGGALHAEPAADVLARSKAASGGSAWDTARSWHGDGTIRAGGLSGEYHVTVDLRDGRSVDRYKLGPVDGADGYDGAHAWSQDPGGEVAVLDTPEALRRAKSQAWLDAHGYWFPQRGAASYDAPQRREVDGKHYDVLRATPPGGDPVTLWFDADSGLLARVIQQQGADINTTSFDDYRQVHGLRVPLHAVTDVTDSAGRTDPRRRIELTLEPVRFGVAVADKDFAVPEMRASARIDAPSGVTHIPFELVNNHIYVDGKLDGRPAKFLVDTGGFNATSPDGARKFGLKTAGKLAAGGVGEQRMDLALAQAHEVRIGAAALADPVFYVIDFGNLAAVEGYASDGLVGYEMFRRFAVEIDYARHVLTLTDPAKFTAPAGAIAVPFEIDDHIPIVQGTLDGIALRISIDTGSRSSLSLHAPFAREHGLIERYRAAPEAVLGWGVGGASRERPARFGTLVLGSARIDGIAGEIHTGDKGSFANPDLGANLGGGVLSRFTVTFDYAKRVMYLVPNARYGTPDAFDRSGLWLLGEGDGLKVVDVAADSAAASAGLKVGDRVVAIDGEPVTKRALPDWRQRLREQPAGTNVAIEFMRGRSAQKAELTLADRIAPQWPPR